MALTDTFIKNAKPNDTGASKAQRQLSAQSSPTDARASRYPGKGATQKTPASRVIYPELARCPRHAAAVSIELPVRVRLKSKTRSAQTICFENCHDSFRLSGLFSQKLNSGVDQTMIADVEILEIEVTNCLKKKLS